MRIAMVASECEPFAKTGGLADVVDALARALASPPPEGLGHEVDVYLPWYRGLVPPPEIERLELAVSVGSPEPGSPARQERVSLWSGAGPGYRLRLVEHPSSFDRAGYYMEGGQDHPDNAARFTLLARAVLEAIRLEARSVDVLHGHDWQAVPALLALRTRFGQNPALAGTASVLTCHNLAYHGWTPRAAVWQLDLPADLGDSHGVDLLREGIRSADIVNTVSPTFARESLTAALGSGLNEALAARADRYLGILNGIDTRLWDPATDDALASPYSAADLGGKVACRVDLCRRHGLDPDGPLLGLIGRLDPQKGFDLVTAAGPALMAEGARLVVLGTGHEDLVSGLRALSAAYPARIAVLDRFDRDEARRIYAGSDLFLMPSRFEPCGQGQMIALRYGTPPIVRATGGLADTVIDADADSSAGTGFVFGPPEPTALLEAVRRAARAVREPARFRAIQARGMARDDSWRLPALRYEEAYRRALASPGVSAG